MNPGDHVRVSQNDSSYEGILLPSPSDQYLILKLPGGYNVGISSEGASIELITAESNQFSTPETGPDDVSNIIFDEDLPTLSLITTGGTIASTIDYRTGAVTSQFDVTDILRSIPDLSGLANYRGKIVANILSENMTPSIWQDLAKAICEEIEAGVDGVIVMHGTDTMQYTAAAISFMIRTPVPIIFTGSQRSSDRPSSDNLVNVICSVEAAKSTCAEVLICMHSNDSDNHCSLHRATRARKNHTSKRSAFETIGNLPLGEVDYHTRSVTYRRAHHKRGEFKLSLQSNLNLNVELIKYTPGMDVNLIDACSDKSGIVIEGTGLGHVHTDFIPHLSSLIKNGTHIVMTSQCIEGRVCSRVYDTGRDLLDIGVIEGGDMLPGTAKVKLMWVLANMDDPTESMQISLAGEITEPSRPWD
jgi:glutamyl-tRNA(Gln) amidotransferase subunit D